MSHYENKCIRITGDCHLLSSAYALESLTLVAYIANKLDHNQTGQDISPYSIILLLKLPIYISAQNISSVVPRSEILRAMFGPL